MIELKFLSDALAPTAYNDAANFLERLLAAFKIKQIFRQVFPRQYSADDMSLTVLLSRLRERFPISIDWAEEIYLQDHDFYVIPVEDTNPWDVDEMGELYEEDTPSIPKTDMALMYIAYGFGLDEPFSTCYFDLEGPELPAVSWKDHYTDYRYFGRLVEDAIGLPRRLVVRALYAVTSDLDNFWIRHRNSYEFEPVEWSVENIRLLTRQWREAEIHLDAARLLASFLAEHPRTIPKLADAWHRALRDRETQQLLVPPSQWRQLAFPFRSKINVKYKYHRCAR